MKAIVTRNTHLQKRRSILRLSLSVCFAASSLCLLAAASAAPARGATVKLEPLADNWISSCSGGCTVNNGAMNELRVRTSWWGTTPEPKNFRPLLQFDLASLPADEDRITQAALHLYYWNKPHNDPAGRTYNVHRLTNSWDEMNSTWQARDDYNELHPVYWQSYVDGMPAYQPGGGDFAPTVYASAVVPGSVNQWMTWDVTDLVKEWVAGTDDNLGLLIKDAVEIESDPGGGTVSYLAHFRSREYADGALRPYLKVTYEIPPIPTVSEWGMIVMAMLMLTAGTLVFQRRIRVPSASS